MRSALGLTLIALLAAPVAGVAEVTPTPPSAERQARNTLYVELLGSGGVYSLNYERFVSPEVALRVGAGYVSVSGADATTSQSVTLFTLPVTVSYTGWRSGGHAFELGAGVLYASASAKASGSGTSAFASGSGIGATAIAGYRYAPPEGGFNFRAAFTPIAGKGGFQAWFGLMFGYGF
jgi:hypothetical protein